MFTGNNSSFALSGLGAGFANRQKDLFASLDAAEQDREEKKHNNPEQQQQLQEPQPQHDMSEVFQVTGMEVVTTETADRDRRRRAGTKQFRGKESIFKRPEMPAPRRARHSVPDHQRNPHKWTKYTLGDVSPNDMSEQSNTATAMSFLRELQARKDQANTMDEDDTSPKQVVFKSSRQRGERRSGSSSAVVATDTSEEGERPHFRSSKLVMPEYIIGQKKDKRKKNMQPDSEASGKRKEISLNHLMDEIDEDE